MSWIHSSEVLALGLVLAVSLVTAGTVTAVTISGESPDATQVGEEVSMTITIEEPFNDAPEQWTLRGETQVANATWTVETLQQGSSLRTIQHGGQSFEQQLSLDNGTTTVKITVTGKAPEMTEFNYDNVEAEKYTVASIGRASGGSVNTLQEWNVRRYTEKSNEARKAISEAEQAVQAADSQEAQSLLSDAKAFYANEEFDRAISNAEDAQQTAEKSSGGLPLIPIAGGAVVLVALIGGGLYYRSRQQSDYKLQ